MEKFIIWLWISLFEFNQDYATNLIIRVKNTPEINAIVKFITVYLWNFIFYLFTFFILKGSIRM
jgi:hypothetical protein